MRRQRADRSDVVRVTTAHLSHTDDIALRQRRYVMTQSVRIVCIALAVALPVAPAWKMLLMAGAIILPWFGVVAANAGPTVARRKPTSILTGGEQVEPVHTPIALTPGRIIDAEQ